MRHAPRQHRPQKDEREAITDSRRRWKRKKRSVREKGKGDKRTFVENEQLATAYYRACERQYLPLPDGEVAPTARNLAIERETVILVVTL